MVLPPLSTTALAWRGVLGTVVGVLIGAGVLATLAGLQEMKSTSGGEFLFLTRLSAVILPANIAGWVQLSGVVVFGMAIGMVSAALAAARRGDHNAPAGGDRE
jgi:ABC-type lipoprotein release transport system permease subunit